MMFIEVLLNTQLFIYSKILGKKMEKKTKVASFDLLPLWLKMKIEKGTRKTACFHRQICKLVTF